MTSNHESRRMFLVYGDPDAAKSYLAKKLEENYSNSSRVASASNGLFVFAAIFALAHTTRNAKFSRCWTAHDARRCRSAFSMKANYGFIKKPKGSS